MWSWKKSPRPDPFEPQPRREDTHGARYWPDTLFVDMSAYPEEVQAFDGSARDLVETGDLGIFVAIAARMHEQTHWVQTIGSTFCRFLARNRVLTGDLASAILTTATPRELDLLRAARRAGVAPAERSRQGQLKHSLGYSTTLQSLFDHWWASVAMEHFLVDGGQDLLGPIPPAFLVGLGLRYAACGDDLASVFNAPDEGFMPATRAMGPTGELILDRSRDGLTVRHIEEGAAMVVQHLFTARQKDRLPQARYTAFASQALAWTLTRFLDQRHSLYTEAVTQFLRAGVRGDDQRALELFLLVCDIALNPAIPDDGAGLGADWDDFHPVRRFQRLVAVLEGYTPDQAVIDGAPPADWWTTERARLITMTGMSDGAGSGVFSQGGTDAVNPLGEPGRFQRRFLGEAAACLDALRGVYPAAGASPLHAADPDEVGFMAMLDAGEGPGYDPPLLIKTGGSGEPSSISEALFARATLAGASRRALHSWIARPGPLVFLGLPSDAPGQRARDLATQRLVEAFGVEV